MSSHAIEVVPVRLEPHPQADSLSIVRVFGYNVCVRTVSWEGVDKGAYIPPDSIVPNTEQFAFLGDNRRIRVKKLRGVYSQGMLVPAPYGSAVGDDVADVLGITHYEPPPPRSPNGANNQQAGAEAVEPPPGFRPKYDVENMRRYSHLFVPGEEVVATEKIHGTSGRWCCVGGELYAGSKNEWKQNSETSVWWRALRGCPELAAFLRGNPWATAYGEVYGYVADLRYGHDKGEVSLALFDIWCGTLCSQPHWTDYREFARECSASSLPRVPELYRGPFNLPPLEALAEGPTVLGNNVHIREGIVVKPVFERNSLEIGRVQAKIVSNAYLAKAG